MWLPEVCTTGETDLVKVEGPGSRGQNLGWGCCIRYDEIGDLLPSFSGVICDDRTTTLVKDT